MLPTGRAMKMNLACNGWLSSFREKEDMSSGRLLLLLNIWRNTCFLHMGSRGEKRKREYGNEWIYFESGRSDRIGPAPQPGSSHHGQYGRSPGRWSGVTSATQARAGSGLWTWR